VNVVVTQVGAVHRSFPGRDLDTVSSVSGTYFRQSNGNPVTGPDTTMAGSQGTSNNFHEGYFDLARVPMLPGTWQLIILETEPNQSVVYRTVCRRTYTATVQPRDPICRWCRGSSPAICRLSGIIISRIRRAVCGSGLDGIEAAPVAVAASVLVAGAPLRPMATLPGRR